MKARFVSEGLVAATALVAAALSVTFITARAGAKQPAASRAAVAETRVQRLVLVDRGGNARGVLTCAPDGTPSLVLHDRRGRERFRLAATESGPYLEMLDVGRKGRVVLLLDDSGQGQLFFKNRDGSTRLVTPPTRR